MLAQIYRSPGSATFLQIQQKNYTYRWLQEKITTLAGLFNTHDLKTGDLIILAVSDEAEFSAIFLAALANGITTVMLDPATKAHRAKSIIERVSPKLIIADQDTLAAWTAAGQLSATTLSYQKDSTASAGLLGKFLQKTKPVIAANDYLSALSRSTPVNGSPIPPSADTIAYIIFTSGTTAASKGVAISFGNLEAHLQTLHKVYALREKSVLLNQLLLWHADGCIQGPLLAAYAGCSCHRPFPFSIDKIPALLDYGFANDVSHWFVVPAMLNMIITFSEGYEDSFLYPGFQSLISVSAHLDAPLWDRAESIFKIKLTNVYGLTETVAGSLFCGPNAETYKKYTAGKPIDTEIRIVDSSGADVSDGSPGELLLKGPHVMHAYFDDPETTAKGFYHGWLLTGDFASRDAEGFITIHGRKKNTIISGGFNIQPEEVTECLLNNDAILEACAIGLPDEVFGEKLVAAVVLKAGYQTDSAGLVDYCRQWLDEKKVPQKIYLLASLPKGVSGKVQLEELREQLSRSGASSAPVSADLDDQVLAIASESFQVPVSGLSISDTSHTISGWDSLAHLTFITLLEERFRIRFTTADVLTMNSIKRATQLVKEKHA